MKEPSYYMGLALEEARLAFDKGEVPIGAVIVKEGQVISRAHNLVESSKDPTAHAEMLAIRQAAALPHLFRLTDCDLYVTVEPCAMCAGAIVLARIARLYIGTPDPKSGACLSLYQLTTDDRLNHKVQLFSGIREAECSQWMKTFFKQLRT